MVKLFSKHVDKATTQTRTGRKQYGVSNATSQPMRGVFIQLKTEDTPVFGNKSLEFFYKH